MTHRVRKAEKSRKGYIIGRAGFAKISAVEGIRITAAMEADFKDFDRKGLSHQQRRHRITTKYGKVR